MPRMPQNFVGPGGGAQQVQYMAIFHSGTPQEVSLPAEVIAFTKVPDLAIIKVRGLKNPPRTLDLGQQGQIQETMSVVFLGFPFGHAVALDKGNPRVSVGRGNVTSITDGLPGHKAATIVLEGDLNPGNSGGPLVDVDGRLVGIIFAKVNIENARIGLAVHRNELATVQKPRIGGTSIGSRTINGVTEMQVAVDVSDPLETLPEISFLYRTGELPHVNPDPKSDWEPMPNAWRLTLERAGMKAVGKLEGDVIKRVEGRFAYQFA